ncbi:MAG: hypothetical protein JKY23_00480 [Nitrospinaceae bacterium]|nr:hypothetical protein [Nitrospinaceae bacterium]
MARPRFPEWRSIRIDTAHQLVNQHRDILNRTRHLELRPPPSMFGQATAWGLYRDHLRRRLIKDLQGVVSVAITGVLSPMILQLVVENLPQLRRLDLAGAFPFTTMVCTILRGATQLRELHVNMHGLAQGADQPHETVPHLVETLRHLNVEHLELYNCMDLVSGAHRGLFMVPALRHLVMRHVGHAKMAAQVGDRWGFAQLKHPWLVHKGDIYDGAHTVYLSRVLVVPPTKPFFSPTEQDWSTFKPESAVFGYVNHVDSVSAT